jgi:hypothetical protein
MPDKMVNSNLRLSDLSSALMTTISIDAAINAKWADGHSSYSPGTTEELALIGIDLLVKELGTEAAQQFIKQIFERYPSEQVEHEHAEKG